MSTTNESDGELLKNITCYLPERNGGVLPGQGVVCKFTILLQEFHSQQYQKSFQSWQRWHHIVCFHFCLLTRRECLSHIHLYGFLKVSSNYSKRGEQSPSSNLVGGNVVSTRAISPTGLSYKGIAPCTASFDEQSHFGTIFLLYCHIFLFWRSESVYFIWLQFHQKNTYDTALTQEFM